MPSLLKKEGRDYWFHGLYEAEKNKVPLRRELEFLEKYIALMKTRMGSRVVIRSKYNIDKNVEIVPHIIFPLLENAFKYVPIEDGSIEWQVSVDQQNLLVEVKNNIGKSVSYQGGLGLDNLRKRLHLEYGDGASLKTEIKEDIFKVTQQIKSKKPC